MSRCRIECPGGSTVANRSQPSSANPQLTHRHIQCGYTWHFSIALGGFVHYSAIFNEHKCEYKYINNHHIFSKCSKLFLNRFKESVFFSP